MVYRICLYLVFSFFAHLSWAQNNKEKAEKLVSQMTLEEKIGQMAQLNITTIMTDSLQKHYDSVRTYHLDTAKLIRFVTQFHIGSFLNGRGVSKESWYEYMHELQRVNLTHSRLKVPILYGVDHVHGSNYLKEGTIFPHNINIAATFDTTISREVANVTVYETSGLGHHWNFAPVMDLGRNKFWGRYYETYGEDPVLASQMGTAYIHALQNNPAIAPYKVAGCVKHFIGYSDPKSGWDRTPAEIPDQILREFFIPSFKAAIDAGVKTLMVNSGELNGIPVHASHDILTKLLREELGFKGVVVTDWLDIISLRDMHFVAETEKEATYMAIHAGIDMSMIPVTTDFCRYVKELVQEGRLSEERISQSARRIVELKYDLGLFETVLPDKNRLTWIGKPESKAKALHAAEESIVLIKNEKATLPISPTVKKIIVTGAVAQSRVALCGGWTYRFAPKNDYWFPKEMNTLLEGIKKEFKSSKVIFVAEHELATQAKDADVIVFAAGEKEGYAETDGTIDDLQLDSSQVAWAQTVFALKKPVVTVLIEGRPRLLGNIFDRSEAVLWAGLPGGEGAQAIAEILSGKTNPSGKMSFTYPFKQGHIIPYNHKPSEYTTYREVSKELKRYTIAEFGTGLSYTQFTYNHLIVSDTALKATGKLRATVTVTNTGKRDGKEAVLWYVTDHVGSITRPVKELQHFEKIALKVGESRAVSFTILPEQHLSFPDKNGKVLLEKGQFTLSVGDQKQTFRLME